MVVINTIFLSGWFQLILLATFFFFYSRRVVTRDLARGYALGWMVGLFFIFVYVSLNPPQAFYLGAYDYTLNIFQVFIASALGIVLGLFMVVAAYLFRDNTIQQSLSTAAITGVFVIAIFMHLIASPDVRLMVSLFILAFGMCVLASHIILMRQYPMLTSDGEAVYVDEDGFAQAEPPHSRLDTIRQKVMRRVNRNDVPTNYPHIP